MSFGILFAYLGEVLNSDSQVGFVRDARSLRQLPRVQAKIDVFNF